ncbi:MAG TPA: Gfo/Idh/MocA family oxidoreductase [Solirubrobacterales bacterium]|nr:Gfo/Idh/MocA family oxidoreductase [Solirubrobacterales bacterium]
MERSPLRAGIAGTGFMGAVHTRSARLAGGRVVGISGSSPERAAAVATDLSIERSFDSSEELVASDDVDVVHICTPNHLHLPLAEAALEGGKHVICEKPLALDSEGAARLVAAAEKAGTIAAVPFVYRYYATVREARERVRTGRTGALRLIHGSYLQDWLLEAEDDNWRIDSALGGRSRAFADIGSHWCDLAEFVSGHRIARLAARTLTAHTQRRRSGAGTFGANDGDVPDPVQVRNVDTEDAAIVQFETDQGAVGSTVISQISAGRKNRLWFEVDGAEQALSFNQELPEHLWCGRRTEVTMVPRDPGLLSEPAARFATMPGGHPQGYADCFEAFVTDVYDLIRTDAEPEGTPMFTDGLRAARITDAVLESAAADGAWVDVPVAQQAEVTK